MTLESFFAHGFHWDNKGIRMGYSILVWSVFFGIAIIMIKWSVSHTHIYIYIYTYVHIYG